VADGDAEPTGRQYTAPGVTVYYDARRCVHFAECVRGLPAVFDVNKRPWIQPEHGDPEVVAEIVRRCPSGALHYRLEAGAAEQPQQPTEVEAVTDGPLVLRGDLRIDTPAGPIAELRASLCRCGLSENRPFCDQACKREGWTSEPGGSGAPADG
jgi:uncharacterized Fe-S cluster protein YjdI/CDGSH-type Zn-finger protein